jgi:hypothetical protein
LTKNISNDIYIVILNNEAISSMDRDQKSEEVIQFLLEFKAVFQTGRFYVIDRDKNNQALIELGLTKKIRSEIILGLSVTDYCSGPEPDRDRAGFVWIFGTYLDEVEIYIKLKVAQIGPTKIAKCISFHKSQTPLTYPLRRTP